MSKISNYGIKPLRQLNFEDVKKVLKDPLHILVVEVLSCETFICSSGQGIYDIVEEVYIDSDISEQLISLEEEKVIFYHSLNDDELKNRLTMPHFFELWREDIYGHQPDEAYKKAKLMGLEGNYRD